MKHCTNTTILYICTTISKLVLPKFRAPRGSPSKLKGVSISVHYELYEGAPILSKWVEVKADTKEASGVRARIKLVEVRRGQKGQKQSAVDSRRTNLTAVIII